MKSILEHEADVWKQQCVRVCGSSTPWGSLLLI